MRPREPSSSMAEATTSSVSASSVPKPSSRKQRVERHSLTGREVRELVGQRQRQRQRREEGLAARERLGLAGLVGVAVVDDHEVAIVVGQRELPARQLHQRGGSAVDECVITSSSSHFSNWSALSRRASSVATASSSLHAASVARSSFAFTSSASIRSTLSGRRSRRQRLPLTQVGPAVVARRGRCMP